MKRQTIITAAIATLFLVIVGVNSGFAKKTSDGSTNSDTHSSQTSGGMHGHNFETGSDFGKHVSEMATDGKLGKEHNPGHHQGFSKNVNGK